MADLGQAYVQIVPSAEGISGSITDIIDPEAKKAGTSAGTNLMSTMGNTMKSVGTGMTKYVTAPIAAVGGASIAAFTDVHTGLENIITKTGASGAALENMESIMNGIAKSVPADFADIGNAIGEVNTRFGSTGDELEDLSTKFIKFADLNNVDVSNAIDVVQASMAAFGLGVQDTGAYLDTLNAVGQSTGVSVDQLASDLMVNAASLKEMGYSASDAANFIGNLNKNGIDSSSVMSGLKRAFANATADGKTMSEAMSELQTAMQNAGTDTEAYEMALELFGNRAGPAIAEAVRSGRLSFDELGTSLTDNLGNIDSTFETTLTPLDEFKTTLNSLKETGAKVGNRLLTSLTPVIEKVADVIDRVTAAWDSLSPETQDMIIKAAMIAAAIGPVLMVIGNIIFALSGLSAAMTLLTGPVGIVIAIIGACIAVGVLLYQNWDEICAWAAQLRDKVVEAWETVKEKVVGFITDIKTKATEIWEGIKTTVTTKVESIKSSVSSKFESIKSTISTAWENVKSGTSTAWGMITSTIQANGGGIQGIIGTVSSGIQTMWSGALSFLDSITGGKLSSIYQWFVDKFNAVQNFLSPIINWLKGLFNFSWSLPHIALPHFSITGSFSLMPPSVPHFSISWYKMGAIFDDPTLIGIGEAGPEAALPLSGRQMRPFAQAVAEEMGYADDHRLLEQLLEFLQQYLPQMANMQMVTDTGALVGQLAPAMDARMGIMAARRERNG